jgi:integrase
MEPHLPLPGASKQPSIVRLELTDTYLQGLRPPPKGQRLTLQDLREPRLFLRVTSTGTCTWSIVGDLPNGQHVRPSLGRWPGLSIGAARRQAIVAAGQLASGINPNEVLQAAKRQREARTGAPTVAGRLAQWRAAKVSDWSDRYRREIERICTKIIEPALGKRPLAETARQDWTGLLASVREQRPGTAAWLYSTYSSFLNFAEAHGWIDTLLLPRKGQSVIAPRLEHRERVLSDIELAAVWQAAGKLSARSSAFVRLLILTGARVSEVAGIAVGEIDRVAGTWTIPADRSKNGISFALPLGPLALAALAAAPPPTGAGPGYGLLGAVRGSALQSPSKVKLALDQLTGIGDWRLHDLRRTYRTNLSRIGVPPQVAERCLNHVTATRLEQTYGRQSFDAEIAAAMLKWQAEVARLVGADGTARKGLHLVAG